LLELIFSDLVPLFSLFWTEEEQSSQKLVGQMKCAVSTAGIASEGSVVDFSSDFRVVDHFPLSE